MTEYLLCRIRLLVASALFLLFALQSGTSWGVNLFSENFESATLGPIVTYATERREREAWTPDFPSGWVSDASMVPGFNDPNSGVAEFEGWTIVDKGWWSLTADDQGRSAFSNSLGKVAVADSDEHDDFGTPEPSSVSPYDAKLRTPSIPLQGAAPNTVNVRFNSSWMPEEIQKATLTAKYNVGGDVEVLRWHSPTADPFFHDSAVNEVVTLPLQNPAGATSVTLEFRLFDATNNWWWAIDNLSVYTGSPPPLGGVLRAIVDRDTGNVKIVNNTGTAVSLRGYSLRSAAGAFNEPNASFLADSDPNWIQLTAPNSTSDLSEGHLGSASLGDGAMISFGNNVWRKYFQDVSDLTFEYLVSGNDEPISGIVEFTGNGDASFDFLDLNFNGSVEIGDWDAFRAGFPVNLAGLSAVQRHQLGDLDNDTMHTANDFLEFQRQYDTALGAGAFLQALAAREVPEPATGVVLLLAAMLVAFTGTSRLRRQSARAFPWLAIAALLLLLPGSARAQLTLLSENFDGLTLGPNVDEGLAGDAVWTDTPPPGWTIDDSGVPGANNPPPATDNGVWEWAGWSFADKDWWAQTAGGQDREKFTRGSGTVMVADPDEWDDQPHPNELYDAFISTPTIPIPAGIPAGRLKLAFDSSWRPEGNDDDPNLANNQRATIKASYNGGAPLSVLTWESVPNTSPNFHPDAPNESVLIDLQYDGTATNVKLTFGLDLAENDWWWAVDNLRLFVPADPSKLRVNLTTGQVSIVGGDVVPASINFIDISSANGVLNSSALTGLSSTRPDSVDGPDADEIVGNSSGEYWQQLSATNNRISEAFLFGSSSFTTARTEFLGSIFNTATPAGNRDITFKYTNIFGDIIDGVVEYFTAPGIVGDYNNDGVVNAADYVVWRNALDQSITLPNDSTPGTVTQADYIAWKANFGKSAGSGSSANFAAVPEPGTGSLAILLFASAALATRIRRRCSFGPRNRRPKPAWAPAFTALVLAAGIDAFVGATASAAIPPPPVLDRNYRMGDEPLEGAVSGGTVSVTRDSAGVPGMQQLIHLSAANGPTYEALPTTNGGPIPKRPDNATGLAIRLNPTSTSQGQHLKTGLTQALSFPERSISSTFTPGGTIDYSFVSDRGFQLWVLPTALPGAGQRADIVMDSRQHGALIQSNGQFAMQYANTVYESTASAATNTWYHIMVVRPFGPGQGSIMYVNGNAVAAATGTYAGETNPALTDTAALVVGANTGTSAFELGFTNRFQGLVDDLEMFVMGLNATADYGDFVFERDNKYAAFFKPANAADLTGDNQVNLADVDVFVDNWAFENKVGPLIVGDLASRLKGDFNYDGRIDLADWEVLNDLAPPGVGAIALARIQAIPEPTAALLAMAAVASLAVRRVRCRTQGSKRPTS